MVMQKKSWKIKSPNQPRKPKSWYESLGMGGFCGNRKPARTWSLRTPTH